ncbi:MAG: sugar phosphate isomerase/epimerase family protein [Anaerolineae bacterium]|jgi:sugar phosphate isomerase/epimerase
MKIGIFTALFQDRPLEQALDIIAEMGLESVEIGTGGYPGTAHADPAVLLADQSKARALKQAVESRGLMISAFSCHGNAVHPDESFARASHESWRQTVALAELLEIPVINTFSGCPGGSPDDKFPNWVTCPWPDDFLKVLDYQWNQVLIPYWAEEEKYAREHGVKIALEMHPGMSVYNPETALKLRAATGDHLGVNFDPSHLFWQGIDPVQAVRGLGNAIHHVHAKDTKVDPYNTGLNGVLDTKPYSDEINRAWLFRSVGYGHDLMFWKDFVSNLRLVGYDYVLSIEHEDSLMSSLEGLTKAIETLKLAVIKEKPGPMFWA